MMPVPRFRGYANELTSTQYATHHLGQWHLLIAFRVWEPNQHTTDGQARRIAITLTDIPPDESV